MKYKKMHYAYKPTKGGSAVPATKLINDLGDRATDYIGTFSEMNPIGFQRRAGFDLAVYVRKNNTTVRAQSDFRLPGFKMKSGIGYHGNGFNNNCSLKLSKQDLLRIANAMDAEDELQIAVPDHIDAESFETQIEIVTGV